MGKDLSEDRGTARPSVIHILEGKRSFELQIWWELPSKSIEVYPSKAGKSHLPREREEEEEEEEIPRAGRRVRYSTNAYSDGGQMDKMGELAVSACRGWGDKAKRHKTEETCFPRNGQDKPGPNLHQNHGLDSSKANQKEMGENSKGVGPSCSHGLATQQLEREPNEGSRPSPPYGPFLSKMEGEGLIGLGPSISPKVERVIVMEAC